MGVHRVDGFPARQGIILRRVRPEGIGDADAYQAWGHHVGRWGWGERATVLTPDGETWGELTFRRLAPGSWALGGFLSSQYALVYRTLSAPTDALHPVPVQIPVTGCSWDEEDHVGCQVAQLYGGYLLPGSRLDVKGGVGLMVSHWNTRRGRPYRVMQFRTTLRSPDAETDELA